MTRKFLTPVVLPADPVAAMEAATKQYVDALKGYRSGAPIYYKTPGTFSFDPASFPGIVAMLIECLGGQGQGGAAGTTSAGQASMGGGGAGGSYLRHFQLTAAFLSALSVQVGPGGAGGGAGNGGNGGSSSVTYLSAFSVVAGGGSGGLLGTGGTATIGTTIHFGGAGGVGGTVTGITTADFSVPGTPGGQGMAFAQNRQLLGVGGGSFFYPTRPPIAVNTTNAGDQPGDGGNNIQNAGSADGGMLGNAGMVIITPLYGT